MIRAENISVSFGGVAALRGVTVGAGSGRTIGLIGPNGSGKSTLLRALSGALTPSSGSVLLNDVPLRALSARSRARRIAVVSQHEEPFLSLPVRELVLLGRSPAVGRFASYSDDDRGIAQDAIRRTGISHLADRPIDVLSGGERQRALIARALAQQADFVLMDEPTNHLDIRYQHEILRLVSLLPTTSVIVIHDLNLAARYCDELVLLSQGEIVASGKPIDVLSPGIISQVYEVDVQLVDAAGTVQLLFSPRAQCDLTGPQAAQSPLA